MSLRENKSTGTWYLDSSIVYGKKFQAFYWQLSGQRYSKKTLNIGEKDIGPIVRVATHLEFHLVVFLKFQQCSAIMFGAITILHDIALSFQIIIDVTFVI